MGIESIVCALPRCGSYDKEQTTASLLTRIAVAFVGAVIALVGVLVFFVPGLHALGNIGAGALIGTGILIVSVGLSVKYLKHEETPKTEEIAQNLAQENIPWKNTKETPQKKENTPTISEEVHDILKVENTVKVETTQEEPKEVDNQGVSEQWMRILRQYPGDDNSAVEIESYKNSIEAFKTYIADETEQKKLLLLDDNFEQMRCVVPDQVAPGQGYTWMRKFLTYLVLTDQIQGFTAALRGTYRIALINGTFKPEYTKETFLRIDAALEKIALPKKEAFPAEQQKKIGEALNVIYEKHYWRLQNPVTKKIQFSLEGVFEATNANDCACLDNLVRKGVIDSWNVAQRGKGIYAKLDKDDLITENMIDQKRRDRTVLQQLDQVDENLPKLEAFPNEQQPIIKGVLKKIQSELSLRILTKYPNNKVLGLGNTCDANSLLNAQCLDSLVEKGAMHSWRSYGACAYLKLSDSDDTANNKYHYDKWRDKALIEEAEQRLAKCPKKEHFPNEKTDEINLFLEKVHKELFVRPQSNKPAAFLYKGQISAATLDDLVKTGVIYAWEKERDTYHIKISDTDSDNRKNPKWRTLDSIQKK